MRAHVRALAALALARQASFELAAAATDLISWRDSEEIERLRQAFEEAGIPLRDAPLLPVVSASSAEGDHDRLRLREGFEHLAATDPSHARAGAGAAAEGKVALPVVRRLVDVHPAGVDGLREPKTPSEVSRPHRRQQAVVRRVRDLEGLV